MKLPKFRYERIIMNAENYMRIISREFPLAYYDPDKHEIVMYYPTPLKSFRKAWTIFHELIHTLIPKLNLNYPFTFHLHTLHDFLNQMINGLWLRDKEWIYAYGNSKAKFLKSDIEEGKVKGLKAVYWRKFKDYVETAYYHEV